MLRDKSAKGKTDERKLLEIERSGKIFELAGEIIQRSRSLNARALAMPEQIVANDTMPARKKIDLGLPHAMIQAHPMEKDKREPPPRHSPESAVAQPEISGSQPIRHFFRIPLPSL
jgi:hypothetical protein